MRKFRCFLSDTIYILELNNQNLSAYHDSYQLLKARLPKALLRKILPRRGLEIFLGSLTLRLIIRVITFVSFYSLSQCQIILPCLL